jgi:hypothetical protein
LAHGHEVLRIGAYAMKQQDEQLRRTNWLLYEDRWGHWVP